MQKKVKKAFEPRDIVTDLTGKAGMVIPPGDLEEVRSRFKEGKRPGHFFAPGCCHNPDYITQVPVLFEDRTYDVMRSMNVRKVMDAPDSQKDRFSRLLHDG
jgi:hypothetical protein